MQKQITKTIFITICLLGVFGLAQNSSAAPSVSGVIVPDGTISDGNSITISGSGFGTKTTAAPVQWDNFENGVNGGDLSTYGDWDLTYGVHNKYSTSSNRVGSTLCMEHALTTEVGSDFDATKCNARYAMAGAFSKVYMSYWMYFQWGQIVGQQKFGARIGQWTAGPSWSNPRFDGCVYPSAAGCSAYEPYYQVVDGEDSLNPSLNVSACFGDGNSFADGEWVQIEIEAMQSSNDMADGILRTWISKPTGAMVLAFDDATYKLRATDNVWNMVGIYHWIAGTTKGLTTTIRYDNIYIDKEWSRVVVCDSATYSSCTHRAMQIPTTWADGSITVTVNQDAWNSGNMAYLYAIDADGNVSDQDINTTGAQGYPITFGSDGGDVTAPTTPSGLAVS